MRMYPIHTRFSWKRYFLPRKPRSSYLRCSIEEGLQLHLKGSSIVKFLRIPVLKNICARLPLKISTSMTNFPKEGFLFNLILKYPTFCYDGWFFHKTCFAKVSLLLLKKLQYFYHKEVTHIKWDVIISSSLRFVEKWLKFDTDVKILSKNTFILNVGTSSKEL